MKRKLSNSSEKVTEQALDGYSIAQDENYEDHAIIASGQNTSNVSSVIKGNYPMTKVNILLVDDNPDNLLVLEAMLAGLDENLVRAESGNDALRSLLDLDFAVILLDVNMPGLDGFETATLIREREKSRYTPIIFLTGYDATDVHLFKGYSLGAVDYLVKPVNPEILRAKITVFVDLFKMRRELERQLQRVKQLNRDVREHKRIDEERRQLLANEQSAREQAEQAVRARDEFLSVAAHELKTPVTSLRGFAQTTLRQLQKHGTFDEQRVAQALQSIEKQSVKLSQLVSQLLDISRIDAGHLQLERELADIAGLVQSVVTSMQPNATRHMLILEGPDSLEGLVDPLRLEQVITNLIDNAVKYSPDGGPVRVEMVFDDSVEPGILNITVTDCGIGIPPERREHIFDRFYRAHTDGHYSGMGLGLYISKEIVQLHGGSLDVYFPEAGGSSFVITIPLEKTKA
jgi:signal transduction histidine kinase